MKRLQKQILVLVTILVLSVGLVIPLVGAVRYFETTLITIVYGFLSEVAGLSINKDNVSEMYFLSIPSAPSLGDWNCTWIKMHLTDESWISMLIRFNHEDPTIDDVARYSIHVNRSESQISLEPAVRSFLSRLLSKSVRYKTVYQQAFQILEEVGFYDGAEALFNDMAYTVSSEENGLVLTWTKTVDGIPCLSQNYWMANNIRLCVNPEVGIVFFGNTWDKYEVENTEIILSENEAKSISLNNLDEEKRGLVNRINTKLFYRGGDKGRDPALMYPCWKIELDYRETLPYAARKHVSLLWADTANLWYDADQGFYGDTSRTMACPYDIPGYERDAQLRVTQHIHSILEDEEYNDTYIQSPNKPDIVASADAPLYRHAVYFDGHGGYSTNTPDGELHVFIKESSGQKVWDYEIYNQTTGLSNLVFLWTCYGAWSSNGGILESGYAQGMGFAYSNRTNFSIDGYSNPDHKGFAFLGFIYWAPYLTNELDNVTYAGEKFVKAFYSGLGQGQTVNSALDTASNTVWGVDWVDCWLSKIHPEFPEPPEWGPLVCYGDGTWTLHDGPPATPYRPSGPTSVHIQTEHNYSTYTTDPNEYELRYEFDWGDDTPNKLTDSHPSGQNATESHSWCLLGTYNITVRAFTLRGGVSGWSPNLTVTVYNQPPTIPIQPQGRQSGHKDESLTYKTKSTDPDNDRIRYLFDWGDGTKDWTEFKSSGAWAEASHSWTSEGSYNVMALAQDEYGANSSDWSPILNVTINGGGCPFVYVWNGTGYVLDNNVLALSEVSSGSDVEDFYRLEQTMSPYYSMEYFSIYSLMLGEFENEHSYIDKVRLYAVDHDQNVKVATTPDGEILTYSDPNPPTSVTDNYGYDCLSLLVEPDDTYYLGFPGDYLVLDFGSLDVSQAAKLVLRANLEWKKVLCIHVQTLNQTGDWVDAVVLRTRNNWSTIIVDLDGYLPNPDGTLKIRLYFDGVHKIDYLGLDTSPQADITTNEAVAFRAIHSVHGNVAYKLLLNDQVYAELCPGEQIELRFIVQNPEQARTFIMYSEGYYETIT